MSHKFNVEENKIPRQSPYDVSKESIEDYNTRRGVDINIEPGSEPYGEQAKVIKQGAREGFKEMLEGPNKGEGVEMRKHNWDSSKDKQDKDNTVIDKDAKESLKRMNAPTR